MIDVDRVRADTPASSRVIHLDNAGASLRPLRVGGYGAAGTRDSAAPPSRRRCALVTVRGVLGSEEAGSFAVHDLDHAPDRGEQIHEIGDGKLYREGMPS